MNKMLWLLLLLGVFSMLTAQEYITVNPGGADESALEMDIPYWAGEFVLTADINTTWQATGVPAWLTIDPANGSDNGNVDLTIHAETYEDEIVRTGVITLHSTTTPNLDATITLNQQGGCIWVNYGETEPNHLEVDIPYFSGTFVVPSGVIAYWHLDDIDVDWMAIAPEDGQDAGAIDITVGAATNTQNERTGVITLKSDDSDVGDVALDNGSTYVPDAGLYLEATIEVTQMAPVDMAIAIDCTASMAANGQEANQNYKLFKAKVAAAAAVGLTTGDSEPALTGPGAELSIVAFHGQAEAVLEMSQVGSMDDVASVRDWLLGNNLETAPWYNPDYYTSIGAGIAEAQAQLNTVTFANYNQIMLLLSDGEERQAPYISNVLGSVPFSTDIYTIAFGNDDWCNQEKMETVANATSGLYSWVPHTVTDYQTEIIEDVMEMMSNATGYDIMQMLSAYYDPATDARATYPVVVDKSASFTNFALTWHNPQSQLQLTLIDPDGNVIDATDDPTIQHYTYQGQDLYRVYTPAKGTWQMKVTGSELYEEREPFTIFSSGLTKLDMEVNFADEFNYAGQSVCLQASLNYKDTPVTGATVTAMVKQQNDWRNPIEIVMYDDGAHGDYLADDGVYGAIINGIEQTGTLAVTVNASGNSPQLGEFNRRFTKMTVMRQFTDSNDDANQAPASLALGNNYPNPFNPVTNIWFNMPTSGQVSLKVYDIRGRLVRTLVNHTMDAGQHTITFDGVDDNDVKLPSGLYLYKLNKAGKTITKKMLMLK